MTTEYGASLDRSRARAGSTRRAAAERALDIAQSLYRANRFFATYAGRRDERLRSADLARLRKRVRHVSHLLSEAMKELRILGVEKDAPIVDVGGGQQIGLQEASRRVRRVEAELAGKQEGDSLGDALAPVGGGGDDRGDAHPQGAAIVVGVGFVLTKLVIGIANGMFNGEEDDKARELIDQLSDSHLQLQSDDELVRLIKTLLDGPTGDDDERAILRIFQTSDCDRRLRLVKRIGLDRLLSDIDGEEWDRFVILLEACGIIGFDKFDDDASRRFVSALDCSQLGGLDIKSVHQLVLNMFAGSCGDDDEDAILKLLRCQSTARLRQLVGTPGTDVGAFDYNFDGSQWDDLEALFAAHGIVLDP